MKMVYETLAIEPGARIGEVIINEVHKRFSQAAYISREKHLSESDYFEFGICIPRVILDYGKSPFMKYVCVDDVFSASAKVNGKHVEIEWPERDEAAKMLENKRKSLIRRAENALIASLGNRLVHIPKVQNGMNPIKEILLSLHDLGEIPFQELCSRTRKGEKRADEYVRFLEDLNFVEVNEGIIYPGNELTKYDLKEMDSKEVCYALLTEILLRGLRFLTENLKIYILTPYLELSNAYYLQSHFANRMLDMDYLEISRHYSDMYRRKKRKLPYQINANLVEMRHAEIIQGKRGIFSGFEEIFNKFQTQVGTI